MADDLFAYCRKQNLADVFFEHRLKSYMAGEVIGILLRYYRCVFGKFNCTKNRGACVDGVIWLLAL
jgi:hypothetical protein